MPRMNQETVDSVFKEMFKAIDLCLGAEVKLPALLLAYTLIDITGWLSCDDGNVRERFTVWVDRYLLPNSSLRCNSIDLYGARCGLLHNYSASSDLSASGKARRLFYAWRPTPVADQAELISLYEEMTVELGNKPEQIVAIQAEDLINALKMGVDKFLAEIANDPQRSARVYSKAENLMVEQSDSYMRELIAAAKEVLDKS